MRGDPIFIAEWLVKEYETHNPIDIAKARGRIVTPRNYIKQRGMSHYCLGLYFIEFNSNLSEPGQIASTAHELGHTEIHGDLLKKLGDVGLKQGEYFDLTDPTEKEANIFTAHLIVDKILLKDLLYDSRSIVDCAKILYTYVPFIKIVAQDMQKKGLISKYIDLYVDPRFMSKLDDDFFFE